MARNSALSNIQIAGRLEKCQHQVKRSMHRVTGSDHPNAANSSTAENNVKKTSFDIHDLFLSCGKISGIWRQLPG